MEIIPAIDIINGKCVRLTQGDYATKKVYNDDPLEVALQFEAAGLQRLHLVDLDGAKAAHIVNWKVLERIASSTNLHIDFGGGIKTNTDVAIAFNSGARQVTGGSIAVNDPYTFLAWIEQFGAERIILGADVNDEKIAISGWQEQTSIDLFDFLSDYLSKGIQYVICTDIAKDGLLNGTSHDLYKKIIERFPGIKLIASGGVTHLEEIIQLRAAGCHGAIIGKALYEGKLNLQDLVE